VLAHGEAFLRATAEQGVAACAKHFPGDGVDERDQHVLTSHNTMTPEAWDASYGRVYKGMIDAGVQTIMIGHIGLPEYSRRLVPGIRDQEILPATLAPEITTTLLRERLGFNGLVVTDASLMLGLTSAMPRERLVPVAIAAGCDMFLRFWDIEEDFGFMMQGVRNGTISQERLSEALHRILGTKAALGLHRKQAEGSLVPHESALEAIGCAQHRAFAVRAAAKGVTLVKDTARQLPLRPETHPRLKLFVLESAQPTPMARGSVSGFVKEELEAAGFEVDLQPTLQERMKGGGGFGFIVELMKKEKTKEFEANYDAVLLVINQHGFAQQAAERLRWPSPMAPEAPWYVHNVPTIAISMNLPNHLIDIPMVKTYVNAYVPTREAFRAALARIMGEAAFEGQYSENVWCGAWDTRL
jgi:beta-N-acetylhexosaminidase